MIRTGFGFRVSVGHLPEVVSRVKEIGWDTLPIADQCSTFAFVQATRLAKESGLRPVYGVRLGVVPALGEKKPTIDNWCFLAVDSVRPLHDLIGTATSNPGREPTLLYAQALEAEGLIKISGERALLSEVPKKTDDFYVGLSPALSKGLFNEAKKQKRDFVAIGDNLYPRQSDLEFYRVAIGKRVTTQTYPQWIVSDDEWRDAVSWFAPKADQDAAMKTRKKILASCSAELKKAELLVPPKPKTLRQMCVDGARRTGIDLKDEVYARRLDHELKMIADKKFEDYFYVLADLIGWAKKRMVVGPARGSSCGSLVCYLLDITAIDPIPHGLMFERFIDVTRADLPDVDVDFSDANRHLVFDYARTKYGADHVARLGSVGSFQAKSALNQAAASLRIPSWQVEKVGASVIKRAQGDSRASQTIEDTLTSTDIGKALMRDHPEIAIVSRLEDHPTSAGQHAAGVVITQLPVTEHVAVDRRTGAIMADKKDAEALGLLKIDALGLTQLSIFERTMELIGRKPVSGWLETLPTDDPAAFAVLNQKKFSGVFQFVGHAVRSLSLALLRNAQFDSLEDLVALTALARPGPMGGGGSDEWIRARTGQKPVLYPHPLFESYLKKTYGVVVYQEQVMAIGKEIGDLSWEEVSQLRRAMSHSYGKEFFDQFGDKWKAGAARKGIQKEILEKIWMDLINFGAMAFNQSHSVAYGLVSYWCLYLKAHHPVEFAAATLDAQSDPADQIAMLRELRSEGIDYVSVDQDKSTDRWEVTTRKGKKVLVGPLTSIRGIGPATVTEILESRRTGTELRPSLVKRLAVAKTDIDSLFPIDDAVKKRVTEANSRFSALSAKDELTEAEETELAHCRLIRAIETKPTPIKVINEDGENIKGDVMVFCVIAKMDQTNENGLLRVQKRGGKKVTGPEEALHMFARDDSGEMFCKVHRYDFERVGRAISERGRVGRAIYALKGNLFANKDFSMMWVKAARYIGEL